MANYGLRVTVETILVLWTLYGIIFFASMLAKLLHTSRAVLARVYKRSPTPRLCGYHLGSLDRPGQLSILDSANCEICNAPGHARR